MILSPLRVIPGMALSAAAKTLAVLAAVNKALAERVSVTPASPDVAGTPEPAAPAARRSPTPAPRPSDAERAATLPELVARPAPEVIAALDAMSTAQLRELYDLESAGRRRRTVLSAIDAAAAPPATAAGADDIVLDEVRQPDELVYSTQTPPRR